MMLDAAGFFLLGVGFGAIVAGAWVRRCWRRDVAGLRIDHIVAVSRLQLRCDRAEARATLAEAQANHWSRELALAASKQRLDVYHHVNHGPVEGDEWKDGG